MDSYDNDFVVLMLDDDLFWVGEDDAVGAVRTESCEDGSWGLLR